MSATPSPAVIEAWASLVRTEKALVDKVEERLKRAGFPPLDWYHVLYEVDRSPQGMLRQAGVQDRTQLAQYNVCRLVDRLEREGLVERRQCPRTAATTCSSSPPRAATCAGKMWPVYAAGIEEHFGARLTAEEAQQLAGLLAKLVAT